MANEFIIKNGYVSKGDSQITGSLSITGIADVSASIAAAAGGTVDLTSGVTGTLPLSNGGLGLNSLAAGSLLVVESNNTISAKTAGSSEDGKFLKWNNSLTEFQFDTPSSGTVVTGNGGGSGDTLSTISIGGTTFTVATGTGNGNVDTSGTPVANDYAKFTDGNTIQGRSFSEVASDIGSSITTVGTIGTGTWQGTAIASAYLDSDTAHLTGTQTFSGAKTFSSGITISGNNYINFAGSSGGGGEGIRFLDTSDGNREALHFPGNDLVVLSNRSANGIVEIRSNTSTVGSSGETLSARFTATGSFVSKSLEIDGSGSGIFSVEGSVGTLFSVDDGLDDVIFAANNISGTPVISANADNTVKLGKLGGFGIVISGSTPAPNDADANIFITGSLKVSGSADFSNATVTGLGALTGNGTSTRVPFYNGTTSLTTNSAFVYTDASKRLDLTGIAAVGNSPLRLSNLQEDNTDSDKGLVLDSSANVVYRTLGTNAFNSTTIPTNTSQLTNGAGFLTSLSGAILTSGNQTATGVKTFSGAISASAGIYLPTGGNVGSFASDCNFIGDRPKIKVAQNLAIHNQNNQQMAIFGSNFSSIISGSLTVGGSTDLGPTSPILDGRIDAKNDVVAFSTSDKRLKDNITPIDSALDKISKIQGIEFDWIPAPGVHGNEGHDVGVIAQEIEEVLPEVVNTRDNGYKAVKYEKIVPLLIESIKELKSEIEELKRGK